MKVKVIDDNTIFIEATQEEMEPYRTVGYFSIYVNSAKTFVCINEPGSAALPIKFSMNSFNTNISLQNYFSTNEDLLFVYIPEAEDRSVFNIIPCFNDKKLLDYIAETSSIFSPDCMCKETLSDADQIILFYGFKLALALGEIRIAIRFWNRIHKTKNKSNCNCNG